MVLKSVDPESITMSRDETVSIRIQVQLGHRLWSCVLSATMAPIIKFGTAVLGYGLRQSRRDS